MKLRSVITLALALICAPAFAQVNPGTSPLSIAKGGTAGATKQAALNNIMCTPTRAGDLVYWNGSNWVCLAGNNSGTLFLIENASGVPSFSSVTGALIATNTVAFSNIVQDSTAWSLLGNATAGTANYAPFTIGGLTQKATPATTDLTLIQDQAAAGALKFATVASLFSAVSTGVNANVLNAQAGNYTIATSDCGATISASGAGTTITLPSVAGFASNCSVVVKNANTTRAQLMSGFPADLNIPNVTCGTASCLFPQQTVSVGIVNGAWATLSAPGRWHKASPLFFANPAGSDSHDCLATGTANACLTPQHALDLACFAADNGNTNSQVQLDDGSYNTGASPVFQLVTHCLGNNSVVVTGNHATPANVVLVGSVAGPIIYAKDKGFLAIDGMKLQPAVNAAQPLSCGQYANIDVNGPIIVTHTPGASIFTATDMCTINLNVALTIQDTAAPSSAVSVYNVSNNARIQLSGVMTFTGTWNFTEGCFDQAGGVIDLNAGSITGGTQTGPHFLSQLNGVIYGGAATKCPGNTAGSQPTGGQAS